MNFKSQEINRYLSGKWFVKLHYTDNDGYKNIYLKEGFATKEEAQNSARIKRQKIENDDKRL